MFHSKQEKITYVLNCKQYYQKTWKLSFVATRHRAKDTGGTDFIMPNIGSVFLLRCDMAYRFSSRTINHNQGMFGYTLQKMFLLHIKQFKLSEAF